MTIAATITPHYIEDASHQSDSMLEQLWQTAVAEAPARRAAAVEALRSAAASVLEDATTAKCFADWQAVFKGSVATYLVAAEFFTHSEPIAYRIPVYMSSDKRRFEKALAYSNSHECYGGDKSAELPVPNGFARVSLERIPPTELIAEHMLTLGAFETCFHELLKPATSLFGKLRDVVAKRTEYAELEALVDNLLFALCGETVIRAEGNRLEAFGMLRRNRIALKLQTLLYILDDSSAFATV